jgi:hypothetical protein
MIRIGKNKLSSFRCDHLQSWNLQRVSRRQLQTEATTSPRRKRPLLWVPVAVVAGVGTSLYARQKRREKLSELLELSPAFDQRNPADLVETMERTGLMGITGAKSVKEELDGIREWHTERGYKGGLVLRELSQPLFAHKADGLTVENLEDAALDPMRLARRECYYLYYEITGTGQIRQQIFCRGTTLIVDVLTCLTFWMVHDAELGCRVHLGFRNQADRILEDIMPLLAPVRDQRTTIEVSGHSLGGAVAYIIAAKLCKRGYRVIRVTSVSAPRFCATRAGASTVESLLPTDNLRIENDTDTVPFLPPFGHNVGNKLYLINESGEVAYVRSKDPASWVDSAFFNFRAPELIMSKGRTHRVPYNVRHIKGALMKKE